MSVRLNICSGYCPVEGMSSRASVYRVSVLELLSGQVTVQFDYCPVGSLYSLSGFCPWVAVQSGYCPAELLPGYP